MIDELINKLTLDEKIALLSGADYWHTKAIKRLNIPSIKLSDGPHGLRTIDDHNNSMDLNDSLVATCFPTAVSSSCSFNQDLLFQMGQAMATEAIHYGVDVILGPGVNIKRNPLGGRNFEYFSEDPYLSGILGINLIKGIQSLKVSACLKHFACNNQEYQRLSSNSIIDKRTFREIYLRPFEMVIKNTQVDAVMSSYNLINGTYSSDNKYLLNDLLRKELNYQGLVMSDWGAVSDRVASVAAGCDLMMPGGSNYGEKAIREALAKNELTIKDLDQAVIRILTLVFKERTKEKRPFSFDDHYQLAQRIAEESIVLLKNEDQILPLKKDDDVCLIGEMAKNTRFQAGGSSHVNAYKTSNIVDSLPFLKFALGYKLDGTENDELLQEAIALAKTTNKVIITLGLPEILESEGYDRSDLKLPNNQIHLVQEILKVNKNVIVLLVSGSCVELPNLADIKGLMYLGLAGEAVGDATYELLYGIKNPSGRLTECWPVKYEDVISSPYFGEPYRDALYKENLYVGYRYYDKAKIKLNFRFGDGLSYTNFQFSKITKTANGCKITVKNIGNYDGAISIPLYLYNPLEYLNILPIKELKCIKKVYLTKGETKEVFFEFDEFTFKHYLNKDIDLSGKYIIEIENEHLEFEHIGDNLNLEEINNPYLLALWDNQHFQIPTDQKYLEYVGYHPLLKTNKERYNKQNTLLELSENSYIVRSIIKKMKKRIKQELKIKDNEDNNPTYKLMINSSLNSTISNIIINGRMPEALFEGIVDIANKHFFRGFRKIIFKK